MEKGDLGSYWSVKYVVIAEPTLWAAPVIMPKGRFHIRQRALTIEDYSLNRAMVSWIVNVGRQRNIPTEIWTFNPDEDVVEAQAQRLDRLAGDVLVGWHTWAEEADAVFELRVDPSIHTVYDADPDRVERLWGMRGHRVLSGEPPSS